MTPTEALDIIDRVCAEVQTTRAGHVKIQEALSVIKRALEKLNGTNS